MIGGPYTVLGSDLDRLCYGDPAGRRLEPKHDSNVESLRAKPAIKKEAS